MRIVLSVIQFPKLSETFIVHQFFGLVDRKMDVHICCDRKNARDWEAFPELARRSGIEKRIHTTWPHRPKVIAALCFFPALLHSTFKNTAGTFRYLIRGWRKFGLSVLKRFYLDSTLISLKPEVIHFEFGPQAVGRMYLKELLDSKVVVSFRGYDLNYSGLDQNGFFAEVFEKSDVLHLLGKDLWHRAQKRGCPPARAHALIPPAVDAEYFDPGIRVHNQVAGTEGRPLRILSVGRLEWKKGYPFAIQAIQTLSAKSFACKYRIIGDGNYLEPLEFLRRRFKLEEFISFLGSQSPAEVKNQMLWADVFLHPAVSEGFCNAVMEAQAMKLPIVCSDADGLSENVEDGVTGFVVPRRNSDALAKKLLLLAEDAELRQSMGDHGRRRVLTHFQPAGQINQFCELYERLTAPVRKTENPAV